MEVWARPADTYVAGFIGSPAMNFLAGTLADAGQAVALAAGPVLRFADGPRPGPEGLPLTIGIRPEHIEAGASGLILPLDLVEPLGSETVLHGRLPNGEALTVKLAGPAPAGPAIQVTLPAAALHVFDAASGKRLDR
jgi:sn-glycerol 3-phosphate transport system ATP-binding protein